MKLTFDIEPVSQLRPKFSARPFPHEYDPAKVKHYKIQLHALARAKMTARQIEPLSGSLYVVVTFYRSIQKSISKAEHSRRSDGRVLPSGKPDV